jgi:hypothetical protein
MDRKRQGIVIRHGKLAALGTAIKKRSRGSPFGLPKKIGDLPDAEKRRLLRMLERRAFMRGAINVVEGPANLFGGKYKFSYVPGSLASDWRAIGNDIRVTMKKASSGARE